MSRIVAVLALGAGLLLIGPAAPQSPQKERGRAAPKLEPVAETRLLMEGLNQSNFRGLERLLKERPADAETWAFARGQALLIAETGNLLLLRPPRRGQDAWMDRAAELREAATAVARSCGSRDYERSRAALAQLAQTCNRCHQTFRVSVRIAPFADTPEREGR